MQLCRIDIDTDRELSLNICMKIYFSDFFDVPSKTIEDYGAFNISLLSDLPLFIDPFLLFNSKNPEYQKLHDEIIQYLLFLRDRSASQGLDPGLIKTWYRFPEIKQNWLGFSFTGNKGSGLGSIFADSLYTNLGRIFESFGQEKITQGSHLEKLCLVASRVGRDNISDFTTNLIHQYLLEYTQRFALENIDGKFIRRRAVNKVKFNYETKTWESGTYEVPIFENDYVLLTPRDMLTKDETWINKGELLSDFEDIPNAIPNDELRAQINNYFLSLLSKEATKKEKREAATETILRFPQIIDYFIKHKEELGDSARSISTEKVRFSWELYVDQFKQLSELLSRHSDFYSAEGNTYEEAYQRVQFLKDVIENKGGHRIFYVKGEPLQREEDVHILYRLTWYATKFDVSREVNDGRGPADFKISEGSKDKSLVEFKLAKNSQLKRNLKNQTKIYEKASDAKQSIKAIVYFSDQERERVDRILRELELSGNRDIVLIDAGIDDKPSGSKA